MMKKGLRVLSLAALFGVLATGFTGCGKNEETKEVEAQEVTLDATESETAFANVKVALANLATSTSLGIKATVNMDLTSFEAMIQSAYGEDQDGFNEAKANLGGTWAATAVGKAASDANGNYYFSSSVNNGGENKIYVVAGNNDTYTAYFVDSDGDGHSDDATGIFAMIGGVLESDTYTGISFAQAKQHFNLETIAELAMSALKEDNAAASSSDQGSTQGASDTTQGNEESNFMALLGITDNSVTTNLEMHTKGTETILVATANVTMYDVLTIMADQNVAQQDPETYPTTTVALSVRLTIENNAFKSLDATLTYGTSTLLTVNVITEAVPFQIPSAEVLATYEAE